MLGLATFIVFIAILAGLFLVSRNAYDQVIKSDCASEFTMKPFLCIGLFLLDKIKYPFSSRFDRRLQGKYSELYDQKKAVSLVRLYRANQVCCVLLVLGLGMLFCGMTLLQYQMEHREAVTVDIRDNRIRRPAFGEGNRVVDVYADIGTGEIVQSKDYRVLVREMPAPSDTDAVSKAYDRLTSEAVRGKNDDLKHVVKKLNLKSTYSVLGNTGVKVVWESSNPDIVSAKGEIKRPDVDSASQDVIIKAVISKGEAKKEKSFPVTVLAASPLNDGELSEVAQKSIKDDIRRINTADQPGSFVELPQGDPKARVVWHIGNSNIQATGWKDLLNVGGIFAAITLLVLYGLNNELNSRIKKRRRQIQCDFPEFINKMTLLVNAGMTVSMAVERIAMESEKETPLYKELQATVLDIRSGKPEIRAYEDFASRCKVPEASKLVSSLILNIKKGNAELVSILRLLTNEFWETRKNIARRMGEEASTKLLLPMMLMLLAVLLIIMTPAIMSLKSI